MTLWNGSRAFVYKYMNIKKKQSFVKSLSFELLGILGTFKMAEHLYPSSPHSKPCSLSSFYIVQTSRYRGQHLCSKFAKIPHMGCARAFKVPTSSRGPPASGITLIAALRHCSRELRSFRPMVISPPVISPPPKVTSPHTRVTSLHVRNL